MGIVQTEAAHIGTGTEMLSEKETIEIRGLAKEIRVLKEGSYNTITWDAAIEQVVTANCQNEDDYFRKIALLDYFLDERQMEKITDLSTFVESLEHQIDNLKCRARGYAVSTAERLKLRQYIESKIAGKEYPTNQDEAYEYYQLLIQKVFTTKTLDQLLLTLCELSAVLQDFYPTAYPDAQIIAKHHKQIRQIVVVTGAPLTKKEIVVETGISLSDVGLIMSRFVQLGIFEAGKNGRFNTYKYVRSTFDTSTLRKEWDWLWSLPYKKLEPYE